MIFEKSTLADFFEDNATVSGENVLIIDLNNLIYRTLAIASFKVPDDVEDFAYWKHLFINNIFSSIRQFEPSKVIFAIDSQNLWRRELYPEYKLGRKEAREKSTIDFKAFFKMFDTFLPELKKALTNMYLLHIDNCEADDIIAVLTKEVFNDSERVNIISTDKDFIQLLKQKNVILYNPIKKGNVNSINPAKDLTIKILMGDKSDNIPAVKKGVGPATAEKIVNEGMDSFLETDVAIKEAYLRNKSIIDFTLIPERIRTLVKEGYANYAITEYKSMNLWGFLTRHRLSKLADDLNNFGAFMRKIK